MTERASAGPARRLVDGSQTLAWTSKCHVGRWRRCGVVDGTKVVVRRLGSSWVVDGDKVGWVGVGGWVGGPGLMDVTIRLRTVRIIL